MQLATHAGRNQWRLKGIALVAVFGLAVGATACKSSDDKGASGTATTVDANVLGTPKPATGTPVKVGFVTDGRTPTVDNSTQEPAAKATVSYINDYMGGIGGRPIDLVVCETAGDPGKATDCGNQLVQDEVVMAIMPESTQALAVHTVLAANNIPMFVFGTSDPAITTDGQNSFMLASLTAGLSGLPIDVAKEKGIDKVTVMIVDVPVATSFYEGAGKQVFDDAGIQLELVKIPLGTADISQQINQVVTGGPTVVHIVGDPSLCIGAMNGLKTNGFDGPITTLNYCSSDAIRTAVGANMAGVIMATPTPLGDNSNPGIQLWNAILAKYDPSYKDADQGLTTFITTYSARQALEAITGEITADTVRTTIKAAPEQPLVTGVGIGFRCNGKADPENPAVCTRGALKATLDDHGNPSCRTWPSAPRPSPADDARTKVGARLVTTEEPMQKAIAEVFTWPSDSPQLIGSRATTAAATTFPAQARCPRCGRSTMSELLLPRRGTLVAWTTQGFPPVMPVRRRRDGQELRAVRRRARAARRRRARRVPAHRERSRQARLRHGGRAADRARSTPTPTGRDHDLRVRARGRHRRAN